MIKFVRPGFGSAGFLPKESGLYLTVVITRDGHKVLRVLGYDMDADHSQRWIRSEVSEYGYLEVHRFSADYIHAWAKLDGINLSIVPEVVTLEIPGLPEEEDDDND